MLTLEPTVAAFAALKQNLRLANGRILPFLSAKIDQALARGAGAFTWELLRAGWTDGAGGGSIPISISAFVDRYAEFTDESTAVAMGEILGGKRLSIDFEVHAPTRQRDLETTYAVRVRLTEADGTPCDGRFTVPSFVDAAGHEPYRLASAYTHKWDGPGAETRGNNGRDLVSTLVRDGTWEGTFFIYDRAHRDAPADAIAAAKAALARSILTALSMHPRCFVERPAGFSSRVWQVRMTLPRAVTLAWGGSPFVFTIPELEKRYFRIEGKYGLLLESGWRCTFVEGEWTGLCQSNGVAEHLNPTPMPVVKAALLEAVHDTLLANGVIVQA